MPKKYKQIAVHLLTINYNISKIFTNTCMKEWDKVKNKSVLLIISSIIMTSVLPNLLISYIPLPYYALTIVICIFLMIIFSLIQVHFFPNQENKLNDLQKQNEELQQENEKLSKQIEEKEKEIDEMEKEIKKYTHNSYAATGIVFNKDYTKVLLAYHDRQKRWIPPGSHVCGVEFFHDVVLQSTERETGYAVEFHESHDYEEYRDANCCVVPCPFSVQIETQIDGEGHEFHYDALYILVADEKQNIHKPGTHITKWCEISELPQITRRNDTYPDVIQSVNDALKIVNFQKGESQNENK